MHIVGEWFRRVWYLLNRRRFDDALKQEMAAHRESMKQPDRFGNALRLREDAHEVWGWAWIDNLARDTRLAVRTLRRSPGFTIVAVLSLAVGLALVASTFAVVNAYLIRALPFAGADRLYHVMYAPPGPWEPGGMSTLDWSSVNDVVEFPITASGDTFYLADADYAQSARGLRVTHSFVEGLGVRAVVGRSLAAMDFDSASDPVAVLGHALWRDRYGSAPDIVGRLIRTEPESRGGAAETFRIVGVLAPDFYFGRDSHASVDLLTPLPSPVRTYMVRLREGVPPDLAERRITDAARVVGTDPPSDWQGIRLEAVHARYVDGIRPVLIGVTIAAGLVLVVVCTNVAVLTVLRTLRRQREMAVRVALGSGRGHLARMLTIEAAFLCVAALGIGLVLTTGALGAIAPLVEERLGRPAPGGADAIAVDGTVLLLIAGVGVLVAMALSFLPLLAPWQRRLGDVLRRDRATSTDGQAMRRVRAGLVALQVAGTLVLLVGGGLMTRSLLSMVRTDLGFETEALVRTRVALRGADYMEPGAFFRFYEQLTDRVSRATGTPVIFTNWPPFNDLPTRLVEAEGASTQGPIAGTMGVSAGYFDVVGIPLRSGREFTSADMRTDASVAVISDTLARRLWPDGSSLGRQVRAVVQTAGGSTPGPWLTVVGVAADVRQTYTDTDAAKIYTLESSSSFGRFGSFYTRTSQSPAAFFQSVRGIAADIDPRAMVIESRLVASEDRQLAGASFLATMLGGFAVIAVGLALLGIYGVTAYAVQHREREIAIRIAIGAQGASIVRLFLRESGVVIAAGLVTGALGTVALSSVLQHQLYGVDRFDAPTMIFAVGLLAAAGLAATWWPSRRATQKNPMVVLKEG